MDPTATGAHHKEIAVEPGTASTTMGHTAYPPTSTSHTHYTSSGLEGQPTSFDGSTGKGVTDAQMIENMDNGRGGSLKEEGVPGEEVVDRGEIRPRRRGCLGFLRRFWWLILIILVIVILAVVLPVVLVAVPNIIRDKVNDSVLTVQGITLTNTQTNSVFTSINATISTSGSIHGDVDGFNASLYLTDKQPQVPFAFIQMPAVRSSDATPVNVSQEVQIYNAQAYADYNTWYLLNESFRMTIEGDTQVHVSGLKAVGVHFQKTINLTGINGFKGLNVTSSTVTLQPDSLGDNFHGFLSVPNPSVLSLEIGNATFNTFVNGSNVGPTYIDNMFLVPGTNNFSIRANISQTPVLAEVLQNPYCQTGVIPLDFLGSSIINHGQHLPYFEQGFQINRETVEVAVGQDLHESLGVNITCPTVPTSS